MEYFFVERVVVVGVVMVRLRRMVETVTDIAGGYLFQSVNGGHYQCHFGHEQGFSA